MLGHGRLDRKIAPAREEQLVIRLAVFPGVEDRARLHRLPRAFHGPRVGLQRGKADLVETVHRVPEAHDRARRHVDGLRTARDDGDVFRGCGVVLRDEIRRAVVRPDQGIAVFIPPDRKARRGGGGDALRLAVSGKSGRRIPRIRLPRASADAEEQEEGEEKQPKPFHAVLSPFFSSVRGRGPPTPRRRAGRPP